MARVVADFGFFEAEKVIAIFRRPMWRKSSKSPQNPGRRTERRLSTHATGFVSLVAGEIV
jgi:hypothetical protein